MARASKKQKVAFVLIDGIGDVHIPELAHLTPLQAAHTPTLDAIAGASARAPACLRRWRRQKRE